MKLMKMTDFVLEMVKQTEIKTYAWYFLKVTKYAQFLKQPLTLDMFIGDKALFEGFEVMHKDNIRITIQSDFLQIDYNITKSDFNDLKTIEDLSIFFEDLTLTPYAIKLLGL